MNIIIKGKKSKDLDPELKKLEKTIAEFNRKKTQEKIHLRFDDCCFSSTSLPLLNEIIKTHATIVKLEFNDCYFFPCGTEGGGEDRFKVIPMLGSLGEVLAKSCVEYLSIVNKSLSDIPAEATLKFAQELEKNPYLKGLTYTTGTRGTSALTKACAKNSNILFFENPAIHQPSNKHSEVERRVVNLAYFELLQALEARRQRRNEGAFLLMYNLKAPQAQKSVGSEHIQKSAGQGQDAKIDSSVNPQTTEEPKKEANKKGK